MLICESFVESRNTWVFSLEHNSFSQSCLFPQLTESIHCLEHHPSSPRGFTLLLYYEYQENYDSDTKWPGVTFGSTFCCSWVVALSKTRRHWDNGPAIWWAGHRVSHPTLGGSAWSHIVQRRQTSTAFEVTSLVMCMESNTTIHAKTHSTISRDRSCRNNLRLE